MKNSNENKKNATDVAKAMETNPIDVDGNGPNYDYRECLFFIGGAYSNPERDSTVSLYIQNDRAYLYCFYGNTFTELETVDCDLTFPEGEGLFITVTYEQGVNILEGLGYVKISKDSASFGACIDDIRQRTMVELYREDWKRNT